MADRVEYNQLDIGFDLIFGFWIGIEIASKDYCEDLDINWSFRIGLGILEIMVVSSIVKE